MRTIIAIMRRNIGSFLQDKMRLILTLLMPAFMVFTASFFMRSGTVDVTSPMNYLVSGVVLSIVFQGAFNNSDMVLDDIASGFMREIIVAPVSKNSIALGNIFAAGVISAIQGVLVMVVGFLIGFRTSVMGVLILVLLMLLSGIIFSTIALFLSLSARNQANYQMVSSLALMPAIFLSGAYIPTTLIPGVLKILVYINPLTYLTGAFRFVAMDMYSLPVDELVRQGIAFQIGNITITPTVTWIFILALGAVSLFLCVNKFRGINLSEIQGMRRFGR